MERWLGTLEAQISAAMPNPVKRDVPDITLTWTWVRRHAINLLDVVDKEMRSTGSISWKTAWGVQQALLAGLATGCYVPACRLYVLR